MNDLSLDGIWYSLLLGTIQQFRNDIFCLFYPPQMPLCSFVFSRIQCPDNSLGMNSGISRCYGFFKSPNFSEKSGMTWNISVLQTSEKEIHWNKFYDMFSALICFFLYQTSGILICICFCCILLHYKIWKLRFSLVISIKHNHANKSIFM